MKTKLKALKKPKIDEDIESIDSADEKGGKEKFLVGMVSDEENKDGKETAEEIRLKMTKKIIKEYATDDKTEFFNTLTAKTSMDKGIIQEDDDDLTKRMKLRAMEQKKKLFYKLAD